MLDATTVFFGNTKGGRATRLNCPTRAHAEVIYQLGKLGIRGDVALPNPAEKLAADLTQRLSSIDRLVDELARSRSTDESRIEDLAALLRHWMLLGKPQNTKPGPLRKNDSKKPYGIRGGMGAGEARQLLLIDWLWALARSPLVTLPSRFKRFVAALKQINNSVDDVVVVDRPVKGDPATSVALGFQNDDLFSVTAHQDVWIVGANDDLSLLFQFGQNLDHYVPNESLVEVVFRLVNHQGCRFGECNKRQHRTRALTRRPLVNRSSIKQNCLVVIPLGFLKVQNGVQAAPVLSKRIHFCMVVVNVRVGPLPYAGHILLGECCSRVADGRALASQVGKSIVKQQLRE